MEENQEEIIPTVSGPTVEQEEYLKLQAKMQKLGVVPEDVVVFRNGEIGRVHSIMDSIEETMYRVYVKVTEYMFITLNEDFMNVETDRGYDVVKILSKDFTKTKLERELENLVLTKEEAQEELSVLKGAKVIIE